MESIQEPGIMSHPFGQFENFQPPQATFAVPQQVTEQHVPFVFPEQVPCAVPQQVTALQAPFAVPVQVTAQQVPFAVPQQVMEKQVPFALPEQVTAQPVNFAVPQQVTAQQVPFAVPQQVTMGTNQGLADVYNPMETAFKNVADGKRPLASAVDMLKEESIPVMTPASEQAVNEPVMKPDTTPPVIRRSKPPPLVKTEMQLSTKSNLNPTNQLTLEQLQIVPEDPYVDDESDDENSDDELDPETRELLLEILIEQERANQSCHM